MADKELIKDISSILKRSKNFSLDNTSYYVFVREYNRFIEKNQQNQEFNFSQTLDSFLHFYNDFNLFINDLDKIFTNENIQKDKDYLYFFNFILETKHHTKKLLEYSEKYNINYEIKNIDYEEILNSLKNIYDFTNMFFFDKINPFLMQIKDQLLLDDKRKISKIFRQDSSNLLYHGVDFRIFLDIINRGSILGHTSHRYWPEGKRYQKSHPKYQESYWMRGLSTSRNVNYSLSWRLFVFVFRKEVIQQQFKIQNYNWFHHGENVPQIKNEYEEFIVFNKTGKTYLMKDNENYKKELKEYEKYYEQMTDSDEKKEYLKFLESFRKQGTNLDLQDMKNPIGEMELSDDLFLGFIINPTYFDYYSFDSEMEFVVNHPKFLGYLLPKK